MSSRDLVTYLFMDTKGFESGAEHARHLGHDLSGELKNLGTSIAGAFGVGFGIERGIEEIKSQIESVVQLSHLSERTGIDINDLRALQREAIRTGTEFETLQGAIKKMQINLAEAVAAPDKEKGLLFKRLKLNAEELFDGDPVVAFAKIGDAMKALDNDNSRVNQSFQVMGRMGPEVLNALMQGTAGLEANRRKVGIIGREDIENIKEAHEAIQDLDAAFGKIGRTAAFAIGPTISSLVDKLANDIQELAGSLDHLRSGGGLEKWKDLWKSAAGLALRSVPGARGIFDSLVGGKGSDINAAGKQPGPLELNATNKGEQKPPRKLSLEAIQARREAEEKINGEIADDFIADINDAERERILGDQMRIRFDPAFKRRQEEAEAYEAAGRGFLDDAGLKARLDDAARHLKEAMDEHDPLHKLKEEAKELHKTLETPIERFGEQFEHLRELHDKAGLSDTDFQRRVWDLADETRRRAGLGNVGNEVREHGGYAGAYEFGSPQAYSQILQGVDNRADPNAEKQTQLQNELVELNRQMLEKMRQPQQNAQVVAIAP